jgi:hypothetical protein
LASKEEESPMETPPTATVPARGKFHHHILHISSPEAHLVTNSEEGAIKPSGPKIPRLNLEDAIHASGKNYVQGECQHTLNTLPQADIPSSFVSGDDRGPPIWEYSVEVQPKEPGPQNIAHFCIPTASQMQPIIDWMMKTYRDTGESVQVCYYNLFLVDPELSKPPLSPEVTPTCCTISPHLLSSIDKAFLSLCLH